MISNMKPNPNHLMEFIAVHLHEQTLWVAIVIFDGSLGNVSD